MSSGAIESEEPELTPIQFATRGRKGALALLTLTAFLGGFTEAMFLVVVTRLAFAITDGKDQIGLVGGRFLSVPWTLVVGLILTTARLGFSLLSSWQSARLATTASADARNLMAGAFLDTAWPVQQGERSGSLQELLTGYAPQVAGLLGAIGMVGLYGANLAAMLGLAVAVDPVGATVIVASVTVLSMFLKPLRSALKRRATAANLANMEFATALSETSQLGMELHVFQVQHEAQRRVDELIENSRLKARRLAMLNGVASPLYSGFAYLALLGALGVVSLSNTANLTSIGAVMLVMLRSLSYGQALQASFNGIAGSTPGVVVLQERLKIFTEGRRQDGGLSVGSVGVLRVENVSFEYTENQPVLRDVSFSIEPREIVGVVGPSGGGKSTLVQLLLGLRSPESGRVLADGRDIEDFSRAEWARRVTFVPQSSHLIAGTVADNIRFLRNDVSEEEVERAARLAHLHDDIAAFPDGYGRQVGEHGGHLSGGQQQRLCIARALVERPDVLILDEPTSALDVRSEHLIRTTLIKLKEQMTVIVIAHRLSTLDMCDRIMVIQSGELKGFDTPERLEETNGFYRESLVLSGMR
jgi:ATP-binding cassette subfamily B protein